MGLMDTNVLRISTAFTAIVIGNIVSSSSTTTQESNETDEYDYEEEEQQEDFLSPYIKVIYGMVIPLMVIICVSGNILTIISYYQDRKLRTVHNLYLVSLATSDLLVGCISMPFYAVYTLMDYTWPFDVAFCKIYMSIDFLACLESAFVIILVSYDRCMLVRQGAEYSRHQTTKVAISRVVISWVLAFIIYVPAILIWDYVRGYSNVKEEDCDVEFHDNLPFIMVTSGIEFLVPLIVISSLNIYLYVLMRRRSWMKVSSKTTEARISTVSKTPTTKSKQLSNDAQNGYGVGRETFILRRERKAARSLAILVGVFALCWTSYTVCTVIVAFCAGCVADDLYEAFTWMLWANSTLNPFLYALTSERFRTNFSRLLHVQMLFRQRDKVAHVRCQPDETI